MSRHRKLPLEWDMAGGWDRVVILSRPLKAFIRYLDRNGEESEQVAAA